jgi:hypothetical protein
VIYAEPRRDGRAALYADRGRAQLIAMLPAGQIDRRDRVALVPSLGVVPVEWLPALPVCIVVPRIEREVLRAPNVLLVLPGTSARAGHLAAWAQVGEHCEITAEYYVAEREATDLTVAWYRALMAELPADERCDVVVRARVAASYRLNVQE